ncbi:hypothetical protein [Nonomuraea sp. NPDC050783]|uniref:hypothetical protein n=1 Tax=Nonomuraea sp. NPDC050783 TaxID=3154634 RepID=UPI003466705E
MSRGLIAAIAGTGLAAALLIPGGSAQAATPKPPRPPKGARAVVVVSPNPTTERGQRVTITGHCGGGKGLRAVLAGIDREHPVLRDIRVVKDDPKGFVAKATLSPTIGNGVGPVFVDCGGEAGVTLLVTHV